MSTTKRVYKRYQQPQPQGLTEWEELTEEQRQQQLQELTGGVNYHQSWQECRQRHHNQKNWHNVSTTWRVDRRTVSTTTTSTATWVDRRCQRPEELKRNVNNDNIWKSWPKHSFNNIYQSWQKVSTTWRVGRWPTEAFRRVDWRCQPSWRVCRKPTTRIVDRRCQRPQLEELTKEQVSTTTSTQLSVSTNTRVDRRCQLQQHQHL